MFTDEKIWCQTINYGLFACYRWRQNWKITSGADFMAFLVKALFRWNRCSKNTDIILSNFLAIFFKFFSRYREILPNTIYAPNFRLIEPSKQKLQRGGGGGRICKKPGLFRVNLDLTEIGHILSLAQSLATIWLQIWYSHASCVIADFQLVDI